RGLPPRFTGHALVGTRGREPEGLPSFIVSAIYEEFERELGRLRNRYAAAPREELTRLFLLALEREEIVPIAYRESAIVERLARMPIDDDVRELIRHALVWA